MNVLQNTETPLYEDTWVTVFGFSPDSSVISDVLQEFQTCGNIQMWIGPPSASCNWVHIQFESANGAQRALQRNGSKLGLLNVMVGVQPPSHADKQYIGSQTSSSFQSAGMQPALPERKYALASTRQKVRAPLRPSRPTRTAGSAPLEEYVRCTMCHRLMHLRPLARVAKCTIVCWNTQVAPVLSSGAGSGCMDQSELYHNLCCTSYCGSNNMGRHA